VPSSGIYYNKCTQTNLAIYWPLAGGKLNILNKKKLHSTNLKLLKQMKFNKCDFLFKVRIFYQGQPL
jgi:hypothetical protein